jgi:seryl-tRNA synthetase
VGEGARFTVELMQHGLLVNAGVPGLYGRSAEFEHIRIAFDELVTSVAAVDEPETLRFPPVVRRRQLEVAGFFESFPHLVGTVFAFQGEERALQETATDLALLPAACYPVYPAIAGRGPLPAAGVTVDTGAANVFRHEPSMDPGRWQSFHMRELVRIGEPETVRAWQGEWCDRSLDLFRRLGLDATADVGADPFFGRGGRMLADSQREQQLKFEILAPIEGQTALASFNYHQEHFSSIYGIELKGGGVAHTACLGFGHERVVLALLRRHGLDVDAWPGEVRSELRL